VEINFRPVRDGDDDFLLRLYGSTRQEELSMVPWHEGQREAFLKMQFEAQSDYYRKKYPQASFQLILLGEEPAGRLYVADLKEEIRIIDVSLLTEKRNLGIGTRILHTIMDRAAKAGKSLTIYVDSLSRSRRLFERLGFSPIEDNHLHVLMHWRSD
jgi:GNAT superfamily N-acetyltransferase